MGNKDSGEKLCKESISHDLVPQEYLGLGTINVKITVSVFF